METAEILKQFELAQPHFPAAAVEAAIAQRQEMTPLLLDLLEDCVNRAAELADDGEYTSHFYALLLLAQFRETRAYPLAVRFALLPGEDLHALCGDFVTEDLSRVLASVCGGDLSGIQSIIENAQADPYVRIAALNALVTQVATGVNSREEIVAYFAQLFAGRLKREFSEVWDGLVASAADLYPVELMAEIERAYDEHLVDSGYIALEDVKRDLEAGELEATARLAGNAHFTMVENAVADLRVWCSVHGEPLGSNLQPLPPPPPPLWQPPLTVVKPPKVGRNEPCPCGSGKKFKKCCGG